METFLPSVWFLIKVWLVSVGRCCSKMVNLLQGCSQPDTHAGSDEKVPRQYTNEELETSHCVFKQLTVDKLFSLLFCCQTNGLNVHNLKINQHTVECQGAQQAPATFLSPLQRV